MSTHDHDDALERDTVEKTVLDAWRQLPKAEPSDALDDRIMAMARRAVAAPGATAKSRSQWPVRLALAATVVLAAGVALKVNQVPSDSDRAVVPAAPVAAPAPAAMPAPATTPAAEPAKPQALDRAPAPIVEEVPGGYLNDRPTSDDRDSRAAPDLQKSSAGMVPSPTPPASPPAGSLSDKKLAPAAAAEPAADGSRRQRSSADEAKPFPAPAAANAPVAQPSQPVPDNPAPADAPRSEPRALSEVTAGAEKQKAERAAGADVDAAAREHARGEPESKTTVARPAPATVASPPPPPAVLSAPAPAPPVEATSAKPTGASAAGPAAGLSAEAPFQRKEQSQTTPDAAKAKDAEADRAAAAQATTTRNETTAMPADGRRDEGRVGHDNVEQRKSDRIGLGGARPPPAPKSAPAASPPVTAPATAPRQYSNAIDRTTPETWILAIQRLYAVGERERAREELLRLRKAFPEAKVPEDLDAALK